MAGRGISIMREAVLNLSVLASVKVKVFSNDGKKVHF
ncbi:hypothetical protein T09_15089 [Trichinella sp. T9]|nr:hypothetical protein T09_15089 [Trichinella sp. T9]